MTTHLKVLPASLLLSLLGLAACMVENPSDNGSETDTSPSPTPSFFLFFFIRLASLPVQRECVRKVDVTASETWSATACPNGYIVKQEIAVKAGAELTVDPATVVKFEADAGLVVEESAALIAEGTADKKIRFTGAQEVPGTWRGLLILSTSPKSRIAFAKIDSAGRNSNVYRDGAVHLGKQYEQTGSIEIVDIEISGNSHFGLGLRRDAKLVKLERVVLKNNAAGAAHVLAPTASQLSGAANGNVFESNGAENLVMIETNPAIPLTADATWSNIAPAKYRVVGNQLLAGDVLTVKSHLTIEAGVEIEVVGPGGVLIQGGLSGLKAVGTSAKPIVFKGVAGSSWAGITFGESTWPENRLENVKVQNASDAPEFKQYGSYVAHPKSAILLGYANASPTKLTVKDVSMTGPNNAPFDLTKKPGCVLILEGTNVGASGAFAVQNL